jgi:hypothetical protein
MKTIKQLWAHVEKFAEEHPFAASITITFIIWLLLIYVMLDRMI